MKISLYQGFFGSVLKVLNGSLYKAFLERGPDVMCKSKKSTCYWVQVPPTPDKVIGRANNPYNNWRKSYQRSNEIYHILMPSALLFFSLLVGLTI